jgi:hypothetical protein
MESGPGESSAWSSQDRESTHAAVLSCQKQAAVGSWYVPFRTGIAIENEKEVEIITHIIQPVSGLSDLQSLEHFHTQPQNRIHLCTDGLYDCASFSIIMGPYLKILIHAHGADSLRILVAEFIKTYPDLHKPRESKQIELAYNPKYLRSAVHYQMLAISLLAQLPRSSFSHRWVNEHTVIVK